MQSKTKIICTIGPTSDSPAILRQMMREGMDVARLNFSHGTHAEHQHRIDLIRRLNKKTKAKTAILQDLEGYRIRIGHFKNTDRVTITRKQKFLITNEPIAGDAKRVSFDYEGSLNDIKTGSLIYIDDGNIELVVRGRTKKDLVTEVRIGGVLKERKGINIPDFKVKACGLTKKDIIDLEVGARNGVEFVAQSFVRSADDVEYLKKTMKLKKFQAKVIAKIENREGIDNVEEILAVSDGIMVARGDMGVSVPIYEIPMIQKKIIRQCQRSKKIAITATQMLESMTQNLRPLRSEVTDIANAILDGSDYLMLSAETAAGQHPVESVKMMESIIRYTEKMTF